MLVCRRRWPGVWLSACSACVLLAGCGSGERRAAPAPKLPRALAQSLAAASDDVAARLDAGDPCGAAAAATSLQQRTIDVIARVPGKLQEPLQSAVNDLAARAGSACAAAAPPAPPPPPPPAVVPSPPPKEHGHGKGHEKKKRKKHGHDEENGD